MDGLLIAASLHEITGVVGSVVERIHMPYPDGIMLTLYRPGHGTHRLFINSSAGAGRIHLTNLRPVNPPQPPDYCMLLRKHLQGQWLLAAEQHGLDRIVTLKFGAKSQGPVPESPSVERKLVIELMGTRTNIMLLDDGGRVLGMLHRREEALIPAPTGGNAMYYAPPSPAGKPDLRLATADDLYSRLREMPATRPVWRVILAAVEGPGPAMCKELALRSGVQPHTPWADVDAAAVDKIVNNILELGRLVRGQAFSPTAAVDDEGSRQPLVSAFPIDALAKAQGLEVRRFDSVQQLYDEVFASHQARRDVEQQREALLARVRRHLTRCRRKLEARQADIARSEAASDLRLRGELILAHMHQIPRRATSVELPNYHDPELRPVRIELDPSLSPAENAERYFQQARRMDRTRKMAQQFVQESQEELNYLLGVEASIRTADDSATLAAIAAELDSQGYTSRRGRAPGQRSPRKSNKAPARATRAGDWNPLRFTSRDGWTLHVGRHNRENDYLTFHIASPGDWWFHVKDEAGSHVIARPPSGTADQIPVDTITDAAVLAAYYSRARHGQNVPVDYTQRKHVRKPKGARPGNVIYVNYRTIYVTPDEEQVRQLKGGS